MNFSQFIETAFAEDIQEGDHSTLACITIDAQGKAILKIKETGILAGMDVAKKIIQQIEPSATFTALKNDGDFVSYGEIAFELEASIHTILKSERLILNIMQRMCGIASLTHTYVDKIKNYSSKILDTRKTTPNFRWFEKEAVKIGGGHNHRMGLYDMIMLKDNHIDFCGSLEKAIDASNNYLKKNNINIPIEIETRTIDDVKRVIAHGGVQRIMFDNFTPSLISEALQLINNKYETEASGGINLETIEEFAKTGVQFISVGAIIHHAVSFDLSLKAVK